jgi:peroxiredoxin
MGKQAPNITLQDSNGKYHSLYNVDAKYTVLCFWDPDCSHCKDAIPKLKKVYDVLKDKDVEVYAANTQIEEKKWKKFIHKHELDWINVWDPDFESNFRHTYDVQSTPKIYLLDEDKTIIGKQLDVNQVRKMLEREL